MAQLFEKTLERYLRQHSIPNKVEEILPILLERIKEKDTNGFKYLGQGGWADVFWLSDRKKVLKVTADYTDARASVIVQQSPSKFLVKTYDVFSLFPSSITDNIYFILNEKLTSLGSYSENIINALLELQRNIDSYGAVNLERWKEIEEATTFQDVISYYGVTIKDLEIYKDWAIELKKRGIQWRDLKIPNVMMRGHYLVISDLGACKLASKPKIPSLL